MKIARRSQEKGSTRHNGKKYSNTILTPFITDIQYLYCGRKDEHNVTFAEALL